MRSHCNLRFIHGAGAESGTDDGDGAGGAEVLGAGVLGEGTWDLAAGVGDFGDGVEGFGGGAVVGFAGGDLGAGAGVAFGADVDELPPGGVKGTGADVFAGAAGVVDCDAGDAEDDAGVEGFVDGGGDGDCPGTAGLGGPLTGVGVGVEDEGAEAFAEADAGGAEVFTGDGDAGGAGEVFGGPDGATDCPGVGGFGGAVEGG